MMDKLTITLRHPIDIAARTIGVHGLGGWSWRDAWEIACLGQLYVEELADDPSFAD